jgi:hypothetical protein
LGGLYGYGGDPYAYGYCDGNPYYCGYNNCGPAYYGW